jgi:hypothetical protein
LHFHIGFFEFLMWVAYYLIFKALVVIINIEARRNQWHIPAAVAGLFS